MALALIEFFIRGLWGGDRIFFSLRAWIHNNKDYFRGDQGGHKFTKHWFCDTPPKKILYPRLSLWGKSIEVKKQKQKCFPFFRLFAATGPDFVGDFFVFFVNNEYLNPSLPNCSIIHSESSSLPNEDIWSILLARIGFTLHWH